MSSLKIIYILEKPNIELLRIVLTPGMPSRDTVNGYVIWSCTSWGERPIHSVKTICWFSPISGIASTGTGSRGRPQRSQSNGATMMPHPTTIIKNSATTNLFSRQKRMSLLSSPADWSIFFNCSSIQSLIIRNQCFCYTLGRSIVSCLSRHHLLLLPSGLSEEVVQQGGMSIFTEEPPGQQGLVEDSPYKRAAARSPALTINFAGIVS
ncbi:hypothetical protein ES703_27232 [subsurface metagenome]